jgi:release factor glutamine methyltransferase
VPADRSRRPGRAATVAPRGRRNLRRDDPAGTLTGADVGAVVSRLRAAGCVFAEEEAALLLAQAATAAELDALVARRVAGEPLEHVLGWAGFHGLRIAVGPGVFVPRRRTEFLVDEALRLVGTDGAVVLDLCCGSGALGAALAAARPGIDLYAADVDPAAVLDARRNLEPFGGRVFEGDLFAPLPAGLRGRVDVLLANVPYVPTGEIALLPPEAREHEARGALDGGGDGLDVVRRVAGQAPGWLAPGGALLVEVGERQTGTAVGVLTAAGLVARVARSDDGTVAIGTRPRGS